MNEIIPKPVFVRPESGSFQLTPQTYIYVEPDSDAVVAIGQYLAEKLRPSSGTPLPVRPASGQPESGNILLALAGTDPELGMEGYQLVITPAEIRLSANQPSGLFRGIQTLRQLLPPAIGSSSWHSGSWTLPAVTIRDWPRFEWRGVMLDVARHFFVPEAVKKLIDLLAFYKINIFHLHLTDDQGWRIMIHSWPRLAQYGGSTQVGGGPGGFYTQEEYASIVAYAQSRYVTLVPEIEMPGHSTAALASYPELTCDGVAPDLYTEASGTFSSLCTINELTYRFLDDVISEVAALSPGPFFHIGGDEARGTDPELYNVFIKKVQSIVHKHGKHFVGWDETAQAPLAPGAIVQHWLINPEERILARKAVEQGARIIMSPGEKAYFDMKYTRDTPFGLTWGGYVDVRQAYEWDPAAEEAGVDEKDILGVEAPVWTETLARMEDVEFMTFPRLPGLAEIGWSSISDRGWNEYRRRLAAHGVRLNAMGVNFYRSAQVEWVEESNS